MGRSLKVKSDVTLIVIQSQIDIDFKVIISDDLDQYSRLISRLYLSNRCDWIGFACIF